MNARATTAIRSLAGDKEPVRLASTGNLALAGLLTVDGVVTKAGDRVLVKDQTDANRNGIYTASEGAWQRAVDSNSSRVLIAGMKATVQEGTAHGGEVWSLATNRPDLGQDAIVWEFFLSTGILAEINEVTEDILSTIFSLTNAADFASRSVAAAMTLPAGMTYLRTAGDASPGDGGRALYKKAASQPAHGGKFQSVGGTWWELKEKRVNPRMFGAAGNGAADDRAKFQSAIDFLSSIGGGVLEGVPGDTYRIVINNTVTDLGLILKNNVTIDLNCSSIALECDGQVYGVRPMNHTRILGPGAIRTTVSTGHENPFGENQAIFHAPISLGAAYSSGGTVGNVSPFLNCTDIVIDGVTIDSARNEGGATMVCGYGGINHITIRNCNFPDNSTAAIAIGFDWSFVGVLSSADLAGNKTRYNANQAYSVHPHDILIESNKIGRLTMPLYVMPGLYGTHGVRLSGVYNCRIVGNEMAETNYAGIFITGGDLSFEYAPGVERFQAMKNIVVEGNAMRECRTYYGIYYEAYPDNIYRAAHDSGDSQYPYSAFFYDDGYQANTRIVGNNMIATGGGYLGEGIYVQFSRGCHVSDNIVQGFKTGIRAGKGAADCVIERNSVSLAAQSGILVSDSSAPLPVGILVHKNKVSRNCIGGGTTGNICMDYANRSMVSNNHVGSADEDQSSIGIRVTENGFFTSVLHNRVQKTKTGGTAYVLSNATVIDAVFEVHGNIYEGSDTFMSGLPVIPYRREYTPNGALITHATAINAGLSGGTPGYYPSIGSWGVGSTVRVVSATTGQPPMGKCVAVGAPSTTTWKPFGNLG